MQIAPPIDFSIMRKVTIKKNYIALRIRIFFPNPQSGE